MTSSFYCSYSIQQVLKIAPTNQCLGRNLLEQGAVVVLEEGSVGFWKLGHMQPVYIHILQLMDVFHTVRMLHRVAEAYSMLMGAACKTMYRRSDFEKLPELLKFYHRTTNLSRNSGKIRH